LILGVSFCNIYLVFLHTKRLKTLLDEFFQLLVHFFRSLFFSILKVSCLFLLLTFQLKKSTEKQEQTGPKGPKDFLSARPKKAFLS
jgi:hypothetical protein